ncbi:MAG: translation elongation factor Ts [Geminicoccaceae bacterium]
MAVSAALVKELREKTGAGMMDCKKALAETDGDLEAAVDFLRKKGLAAAAKKSGRAAAEGLVAVQADGRQGAMVEINAETDFVARNEDFQKLVLRVVDCVPESGGDVEVLNGLTIAETGRTVAEELTNAIATIGENMSLRRAVVLSVDEGVVVPYVHAALSPGLGRIGVLVAVSSSGDAGKLAELGKQVAMHVAAARPESLTIAELDPSLIERERSVLSEQARESGKPENIIEKMVEGRLRKFYEENVLLEQVFVVDPDLKVKDAVAKVAQELGTDVTVTGFARFNLGEGIEKAESDLAAEVAATLAGN